MPNRFITTSLAAAAIIAAIAQTPTNAEQFFAQAKIADDAADYSTATILYLKADSAYLSEGLSSTPEYARALHNTGRAFLCSNNFEEGRKYTLQAANLREKLFGKRSKEYIASLDNIAVSYVVEGDYEKALQPEVEVVNLCRKIPLSDFPDQGRYFVNLGRIYMGLDNKAKAIELYEEALPKVEKFGSDYEIILQTLGIYYFEADDNENAYRIMELLEEHNQNELKKECNAPECHIERARYYMNIGETAHAKDEFLKAFAFPLNEPQKADAFNNYGIFLASIGDYIQSADYFFMAAQAASTYDDRLSTDLLSSSAISYYLGEDYDKAIETHNSVMQRLEKVDNLKLKATTFQQLGNAYSAKKDYAEAIRQYTLWLNCLESDNLNGSADYALALTRIASSQKSNREYEAAIGNYEKAIHLYGKLKMFTEQEQAESSLKLCRIYADKTPVETTSNKNAQNERAAKLNTIIRQSKNTLAQSGEYLGKLSNAEVLATIAGCYSLLGDYEQAIDYFAKYIPSIRDALASEFLLKNPKERSLTWEKELNNITQMDELVSELPFNPDLYSKMSNLIYEGQLLSKGILLTSNIEFEKVIAQHATPQMLDDYNTIRDNTTRLDNMRLQGAPLDKVLELQRETEALQLNLARSSSAYADYTNYLRITTADILKHLPSDAMAIEFVTLGDNPLPSENIVIAAVLSHDFPLGLTIPVCSVKELEKIIDDPKKFSNENYAQAIWGNITSTFTDKKKIFFAPDGLLNNIGIEYLTLNGRPLSEQYEITRLSSTREIARQHDSRPIEYAALFGDIDYLEDGDPATDKQRFNGNATRNTSGSLSFTNLNHTAREIAEIAAVLSPRIKEAFAYTGIKASKEEFLSQSQVPLNLLHVATHGKYLSESSTTFEDPMRRSILAFAGANLYDNIFDNKALVTAAEIADMTLNYCDLVVLSACESGLGKLDSDGVFGLQRGFKNAGAKTLLVSLSEVADEATANMMIAFYRHLFSESNMSAREALRKAQADIKNAFPDDNTWASFILIDAFN